MISQSSCFLVAVFLFDFHNGYKSLLAGQPENKYGSYKNLSIVKIRKKIGDSNKMG